MAYKRVDIKTGYLCNCNCKFCVQAHNKVYANKDNSEIKQSIDNANRDGYDAIVFTGGEFTLRKDCLELVKYARDKGIKDIQIQSNGRMFSSLNFCKKIIAAGANEFSPALHGYKEEIHDYLTSSPGAYRQTVKGIENLKSLGQYIIANSVIVKPNYRFAPELAELFCKLKVDQFQFAFVHALGNAKINLKSMLPNMTLVVPYLKKGIDIAINNNVKVMVEGIPFCMMKGYERYVSEIYIPETRIEERDRTVDDFKAEARKSGKKKFDVCAKCRFNLICDGPWREYPETFGEDEFKAVEGPIIKDTEELFK